VANEPMKIPILFSDMALMERINLLNLREPVKVKLMQAMMVAIPRKQVRKSTVNSI